MPIAKTHCGRMGGAASGSRDLTRPSPGRADQTTDRAGGDLQRFDPPLTGWAGAPRPPGTSPGSSSVCVVGPHLRPDRAGFGFLKD